jgi:hypothetical protein
MAGQISQNPDGTYSRTYSDTEIMLIRSLQDEINSRQTGDNELWAITTTLENRLDALEQGQYSLSELQASIMNNIKRTDDQDLRIQHLEDSVIIEAYSKEEMNPMWLIPLTFQRRRCLIEPILMT